MNFEAIPVDAAVFVDANVFIYAFAADVKFGHSCIDLLERIESGQIKGLICATVLSEVAHRLMTIEACETFGWPYPGIAQRLRHHPDHVRRLHRFCKALDEIAALRIEVFPISDRDILRAAEVSKRYGLLSNDALIVAMMEDRGVTHLASNDADFDGVPSLLRYAAI